MDSILGSLSNMLYIVIDFLLGWVNLPAFPETLSNSINEFLDLIFNNLSLLGFFVRPATLKISVVVLIAANSFGLVYGLLMWIIRKIPFLNIS